MTSLPAPEDVQAAFSTVLVDEWLRAGVSDAVACPGSRSTPLLIALAEAAEHGSLRLHVLADERAAGFFALGLALATGVPAPVVTTSGTAASELHPAVIEAHHAGVPMLAVTADRPAELHGFGAPQTVDQEGLFGSAVRWEVHPGPPELAAAWSWRSLASRSFAEACGGAHRPGPVHLNLAFREPLVGSAAAVLQGTPDGAADAAIEAALGAGAGPDRVRALRLLRRGRADGGPWHSRASTGPGLSPPPIGAVDLLAAAGERGLIVAGAGAGDPEAVWALSKATGWPVLATPQSGCRLPGAIASADALVRTEVVRWWRPDLVVRLGAPWASRVLNEWLAGLSCTQVLVDPGGTWAAPDRPPGEVIVASPELVCQEAAARVKAGSSDYWEGSWARQWSLVERTAQAAIDAALAAEDGLTEPAIARTLLEKSPAGATIFASSSMPVREVEWWSQPRAGVRVLANRGANGIDGVLSTALGVATSLLPVPARPLRPERAGAEAAGPSASMMAATPEPGPAPVVALVGDLAFLYDATALLAGARAGVDLDVIVVDNDGGGIFSFLPQASGQPPERFERLWGTAHGADLVAVARGYGAAAEELDDLKSLATCMAGGGAGNGLRVFVAKTDRAANVAVHQRLNRAVEKAVQSVVG
jgi:2-succinyl-5-enolpyruvyl-6-hydroxy-3-cyclohexene-1-carboxylate synthase